ncbi:hypothetical protein SLEP1_g43950 [Rubroshorea leprosula]|uniref:Dof zinc finger protein n=1 Tax=Rubroshorea leprosula TaxID=152421 RepID=A0AAV5LEN3_9ROSI|nr:hypothetical protein SLEP1_g43950 [Rubroshorea leprosula]
MQDPSTYNQMKSQFPGHEQLKCPRCDSTNTKFCYYNNYNLLQPRYFCKNCRRYWTKGGALRNIPVGGGSRKNNTKRSNNPKRQANSAPDSEPARIRKQPDSSTLSTPTPASTSTTVTLHGVQNLPLDSDPSRMYGLSADQDTKMLDIPGSFSSLLSSNGHLLEGLNPDGSGLKTVQMGDFRRNADEVRDLNPGSVQDPGLEGSNNGDSYLGVQNEDSSCWGGGSNGWPDLAIYTPGSSFQ